MKNLFILLTVFILASCSNDDDSNCGCRELDPMLSDIMYYGCDGEQIEFRTLEDPVIAERIARCTN